MKAGMSIGTNVLVALTLSGGSAHIFADEPNNSVVNRAQATSGMLEEIVVKAQRREERSQDVPIAISVIGNSVLTGQGPVDTSSLASSVPGLDFSRQASSGGTPFLRGVGTSSVTVGAENSVATYVDDVYLAAPAANIFSLNNIERIEVLAGPQGTLFGRNATGGVIHVITRNPSFESSGEIGVSYGKYETSELSLYATTGLSDTVAGNIAAQVNNQGEGWGRALANGSEIFKEESLNLRGKLLWEPSERTTVLLSADYSKFDSDIGANFSPLDGTYALTGLGNPGRYNSLSFGQDFNEVEQSGLSAKLETQLEIGTLVSISAWRAVDQEAFLDQDSVPTSIVDIPYSPWTNSFSQELQLQSRTDTDSRLEWITGVFYLWSDAAYDPLGVGGLAIAPLPPEALVQTKAEQTVRSYAIFAQASYEVLPDTELTLGARYTRDEYDVNGKQWIEFPDGSSGEEFAFGSQSSSFSKPTFLISLDHRFTQDLMAYASYSRGFKSGGYNILSYTSPPVDPEVLDAYQLGVKSEWLNNSLRLNASLFYYDYQDLHVQFIDTGASFSVNAGEARITGADLQLTAALSESLTISASGAYLDGEYTEFPLGFLYEDNPQEIGGTTQILNQELRGRDTARTPTFTANLTINYDIPLSGGVVSVAAKYYYNDGFYWDPANQLEQPGYELISGHIRWQPSSGGWDVSLWGNNLLDEEYFAFATLSTFGHQTSPAHPRSYGVTARMFFE